MVSWNRKGDETKNGTLQKEYEQEHYRTSYNITARGWLKIILTHYQDIIHVHNHINNEYDNHSLLQIAVFSVNYKFSVYIKVIFRSPITENDIENKGYFLKSILASFFFLEPILYQLITWDKFSLFIFLIIRLLLVFTLATLTKHIHTQTHNTLAPSRRAQVPSTPAAVAPDRTLIERTCVNPQKNIAEGGRMRWGEA